MKTRVGKRYRINAYAEEPLYMKLLAYKKQSGLTESAIVNLALYHFFSEMERKGMLAGFVKDTNPSETVYEEKNTQHEETKEKKFKLYFDF